MTATRVAFLLTLAAAAAAPLACGDESRDRPASTPAAERAPIRCSRAPAWPRGTAVTFAAKWKTGERRALTIRRERSDTQRPGRATSTTTSGNITVLRRTPTRSLLRLELGVSDLGGTAARLPPKFRAALRNLARDTAIEYATHTDGSFASIENLAAVRTQARTALARLERLVADEPAARAAFARLRPLFGSEAFVSARSTEQIAVLHGLYGLSLRPDERRTARSELPNVLGGESFPATSSVRFVDLRDAANCGVLEVVTVPEPRQFRRIITRSVERLAGRSVEQSKIPALRLRQVARYQWDAASGWIVRADATNVVTAPGRKRTDRTVIESRAR